MDIESDRGSAAGARECDCVYENIKGHSQIVESASPKFALGSIHKVTAEISRGSKSSARITS